MDYNMNNLYPIDNDIVELYVDENSNYDIVCNHCGEILVFGNFNNLDLKYIFHKIKYINEQMEEFFEEHKERCPNYERNKDIK